MPAKAKKNIAAKQATKNASIQAFDGMGALVTKGGTNFRVWAPNADAVHVTGSFTDWEQPGVPLESEGNGNWAGFVKGAKAGDPYKFHLKNGSNEFLKADPRAREIDPYTGNGVIYQDSFDWGDDHFQTPPLNEVVLYELHVGTFGGGKDGERGTFAGVANRLPYLQKLGVNAIELMPPTEFPGETSWGYNPSHPFAVEADYGGPDALKALIKAAHEHGIAVILDVVYNHFGPDELDLWQFDGWQENDGGGIYFYNDWRAETPWGANRPDYGREEVRAYIRDNAMMWIKEFRTDGLRLDAVSYIRATKGHDSPESANLAEGWQVLQWINKDLKAHSPRAISIAEDLGNSPSLTKPVEAGGAGFDTQWDPGFVNPIRSVLKNFSDDNRDIGALANAILSSSTGNPFQRVIFAESHDEVANGKKRMASEIDENDPSSVWAQRRSLQAAGLVLTSPGLPMLFQGQEFLEDGWFDDHEMLDWAKKSEFRGIHRAFSDLIRLRRNLDGKTRGLQGQHVDVFHQNHVGKVLAWHRWYDGGPGDSTVVLLNCTAKAYDLYEIALPAGGAWNVRFNADWNGYSKDFGNTEVLTVDSRENEVCHPGPLGGLKLPPYGLIILSQD